MRILILVAVIFALAYAVRTAVARLRAADEAHDENETAASLPSPWRAVTIRTGDPACDTARQLEGKRFLLSEAPDIPLAECDIESCRCTFSQFDDRRSGSERRDVYDMHGRTTRLDGEEQRESDRRED
jgi:hypothetical protein